MKRLGLPATLWRMSGSSSVHPTKVAMAPALCRMIAPIPTPNKARRPRKTADSTRARRTPGSFRVAVGAAPESTAWPTKKDRKLRTSPKTSANGADDDRLGGEEHRTAGGRRQ